MKVPVSGLFHTHGIRNRELVTASGAAGGQHLTATFGAHAAAKPMLIDFFPTAWLKCPFHRYLPVYY